ncbi:MAG: DUF1361 domain-containing protein [bacterium]
MEGFQPNGVASLDIFFANYQALTHLTIFDYPIIMVIWNLLLLVVPFFLVWVLMKYWKKNRLKKFHQQVIALFLGLLWLLFIPNAAYVITDARHIITVCSDDIYHWACPAKAWAILFFFTYALVGWLAFVYLMRQMRDFLKKVNQELVPILPVFVIPLISIGIMLGLINRWNSWEFFLDPVGLVKNIIFYFTHLSYFVNWLIFSVFLYILYWIGDCFLQDFAKIRKKSKK